MATDFVYLLPRVISVAKVYIYQVWYMFFVDIAPRADVCPEVMSIGEHKC